MDEKFSYTYSAKEQDEVKRIREKYTEKGEDKLELLRRLDRSVTEKASVVSLIVGVIGTLLLGVGMCCTLVWAESFFILGVIVGIIGIIVLAFAYPIYSTIIKKEREKIAPEILKLTDELLK